MSMNAVFVQIEDREIARFEAVPDSVEALFSGPGAGSDAMLKMAAVMQERLKTVGPQAMAASLSSVPEPVRKQLEESLARIAAMSASGTDFVGQLNTQLGGRGDRANGKRETLSLDKAWHGVHYLLSGAAEPGKDLRSQAVLGGVELGDDPEGFSGYGPARYFRAAEVREIAEELARPEVMAEAASRFDPTKMTQLEIYPGWSDGDEDKEWLVDAFVRLRDFYLSAATQGRAIVTCLV